MMSSLKLMKEDQHAIEIIDSLFIGSVGVSTNKEELINKKISHIKTEILINNLTFEFSIPSLFFNSTIGG